MNQYRIKKGKKPTQRASVIIAGTRLVDVNVWIVTWFNKTINTAPLPVSPDELVRSDCSSLSSLPLDDGESHSNKPHCIMGIKGKSVSIAPVVCLYNQTTQTGSVRGLGPGQCRAPLSSAQCARWGRTTRWTDKDLHGKTTTATTTAGRECNGLPARSHAVSQLVILLNIIVPPVRQCSWQSL